MRNLFLCLLTAATAAASTAQATPYVLDVQLEGPPTHRFVTRVFPVPSGTVSETWGRVSLPGPPLGTTSVDIQVTLPAIYRTLETTEPIDFRVDCTWGGAGVSAGSQRIDVTATGFFETTPDDLDLQTVEFRSSGPQSGSFPADSVAAFFDGDLESGDRVQGFRLVLDDSEMGSTQVNAGSGGCQVNVTMRGDSTLEDQPLLQLAPLPLSELAATLAGDAAQVFADRFGAGSTPSAGRVETELTPLVDALVSSGCMPDGVSEGIAGAYGTTDYDGLDTLGEVTDATLDRANRRFGGTLSTGVGFGAPGDVSGYNDRRQVYAETEEGGFVAGRFSRVRGTLGVFHVLTGTCADGVEPRVALQDWYDGPLPQ